MKTEDERWSASFPRACKWTKSDLNFKMNRIPPYGPGAGVSVDHGEGGVCVPEPGQFRSRAEDQLSC